LVEQNDLERLRKLENIAIDSRFRIGAALGNRPTGICRLLRRLT
jgi:hypothetical protein